MAGIRSALALGPTGQLDQARALLAQSEAAIGAPGQDALAADQALAALLGRAEPDDDWLRPGPLPGIGDWQASALPADLLRTRPDIARAQAAVLRAAGEAGLARAERFPDVGLGGSIRWSTSTAAHEATRTDEAIAGFGPVIDIPLFDWGMRKSRADASGAPSAASRTLCGFRSR